VTVRDAIGDLEPLENGDVSKKDKLHFAINHVERNIKWLKRTPEGKSAHQNKDPKFRPPSGYLTTYKRIWWDRPSPAITTCFSSISSQNNVHPRDTRALTIREAARIQTFPDDFKFMNSISSIRKQIGNAVPPLLAKVLAKKIREYF
jgi:DNA (cytosine-5)-methyltransferase 1